VGPRLRCPVLGTVIGLVWSDWSGRDGASGDVLVLTSLIASSVVLTVARWAFRRIFGPGHPELARPDPHDPPPLWFWVGGVSATGATVVARIAADSGADEVTVVHSTPSGGNEAVGSAKVRPDAQRFARLELADLAADHRYELRIEVRRDGEPVGAVTGSFTEFPAAGEPASTSMVFGSCLSTGLRGRVFDSIAATWRHATPRGTSLAEDRRA
jgi:hypothetical protein